MEQILSQLDLYLIIDDLEIKLDKSEISLDLEIKNLNGLFVKYLNDIIASLVFKNNVEFENFDDAKIKIDRYDYQTQYSFKRTKQNLYSDNIMSQHYLSEIKIPLYGYFPIYQHKTRIDGFRIRTEYIKTIKDDKIVFTLHKLIKINCDCKQSEFCDICHLAKNQCRLIDSKQVCQICFENNICQNCNYINKGEYMIPCECGKLNSTKCGCLIAYSLVSRDGLCQNCIVQSDDIITCDKCEIDMKEDVISGSIIYNFDGTNYCQKCRILKCEGLKHLSIMV